MMAQIEAMVEAATSLEELREMMRAGFDTVDNTALRATLDRALVAATGAGRVVAAAESAS